MSSSSPATPASAKAAAAAESAKAAAAKAAAAESITAATPKAITTEISATRAALEVLEALARKVTSRSVLSLAIDITEAAAAAGPVEAASAARSIRTAFASSTSTACVGAIGTTGCRLALLIILASRPLLVILCALPIRLRFVHRVPTTVVVLFPAVTSVLINITIVSSIHIAACSFTDSAVSPLRTGGSGLSSLRSLGASHCSIGRGVMARGSALVSSRNIRTAPLSVRA